MMATATLCCLLITTHITHGTVLSVPDGPIMKPRPSKILYRIGDRTKPLILTCSTKGGSSSVRFWWNKDGERLDVESDLLQYKTVGTIATIEPTVDDEGLYQCFAKSDAGVASTTIISVKRAYINVPKVTLIKHRPIEGNPYELNCTIPDAYPKPKVIWVYQSTVDPNISIPIVNKRILQSPEGVLYFSNITQEDVRENIKYVCIGKTPASDVDVVLAEHVFEELITNDRPSSDRLTKQYVTKDLIAKVGDVTMIYCIYGGTPLAHPHWFKGNINVDNKPNDRITRYNKSAGKRLIIKETWLEDEGNYTCSVQNCVSEPVYHSMYLKVVSVPTFHKRPEPIMVTREGVAEFTIPCEVAAVPNAEVTWTYNGELILKSFQLSWKEIIIGNITIANLSIIDVNLVRKGYYGCKAANEYGNIYAETLLFVY